MHVLNRGVTRDPTEVVTVMGKCGVNEPYVCLHPWQREQPGLGPREGLLQEFGRCSSR